MIFGEGSIDVSTKTQAIKLQSNSLINVNGFLSAFRNDYGIAETNDEKNRIAIQICHIWPTLTLEEVIRLLEGNDGEEYDVLDDGSIIIMKTEFWLKREILNAFAEGKER